MSAFNSSNYAAHPTAAEGILSDKNYLIAAGVESVIRGLVSLLGISANLINIVTYISMRPNDITTVSFLVLACSDISYLATMVCCAVSFGFYLTEKIYNLTIWFPVDPYGVYIFFSNVGNIPYTLSILITTLLSVARCISVWKPLEFKIICRPIKSLYILTIFLLFAIGGYLPILVYMGMIDQFNPGINASRPTLWISPKREQIRVGIWTFRDAILPTAYQLIVFACVIIMAHSLKKSSSFRQSQYRETISETKTKATKSENSEAGAKLTGKELHALQQVLYIAVIFIVCNAPKVLLNFTFFFVPGLSLGQINQNMYLIAVGFVFLLQVISSSSSFLIYYKYSTKFRKHFALCFKLR